MPWGGTHKSYEKTLRVTEPGTHLMPTVAWWFTTKKLITVVAPCKQGVSRGDGYSYRDRTLLPPTPTGNQINSSELNIGPRQHIALSSPRISKANFKMAP
jgi:hypothetical protein